MKKLVVILLVLSFPQIFSQNPGVPFNPMTAPGARGIRIYNHILHWNNPSNVIYNKVYFSDDSSLVANLNPISIIFDGYPSNSISELSLGSLGSLEVHKKYFWRVVNYEYNNSTAGPIWYFRTNFDPTGFFLFEDDFENMSDEWIITNDGGTCIWQVFNNPYPNFYTLPITSTGKVFVADADNCGSGSTTLTSARLDFDIDGEINYLVMEWDNDWQALNYADSAFVEMSVDFGLTWQVLRVFNGNDVRNTHEYLNFNLSSNNALSLRFRSVQPGWDWWWAIDNLSIEYQGPMYVQLPPTLLTAFANDSIHSVRLNWNRGWSFFVEPIIGYKILRKIGLPSSNNLYEVITQTDSSTFEYFDIDVVEGEIYTYKIQTIISTGAISISGNEATAYIPEIVPVELSSFTSSVTNNNVTLNWQTATETNNQGFQVERRKTQDERSEEWKNIGFVNGAGTTTEPQAYSFIDKNLAAGKYQYRLKQIDYDGTFEYLPTGQAGSKTIEVEINSPTKFSLEQNYPNPFNPTTKISWQSPVSSWQTIKIFNALGQEVETIVSEWLEAGVHSKLYIVNSTLPSGVYFYQLRSGEFVETKKMLFLK